MRKGRLLVNIDTHGIWSVQSDTPVIFIVKDVIAGRIYRIKSVALNKEEFEEAHELCEEQAYDYWKELAKDR